MSLSIQYKYVSILSIFLFLFFSLWSIQNSNQLSGFRNRGTNGRSHFCVKYRRNFCYPLYKNKRITYTKKNCPESDSQTKGSVPPYHKKSSKNSQKTHLLYGVLYYYFIQFFVFLATIGVGTHFVKNPSIYILPLLKTSKPLKTRFLYTPLKFYFLFNICCHSGRSVKILTIARRTDGQRFSNRVPLAQFGYGTLKRVYKLSLRQSTLILLQSESSRSLLLITALQIGA